MATTCKNPAIGNVWIRKSPADFVVRQRVRVEPRSATQPGSASLTPTNAATPLARRSAPRPRRARLLEHSAGVVLRQSGYEPGATVTVSASLTQSGLPAEDSPLVAVEVDRPDGRTFDVVLVDAGEPARRDGWFAGSSGEDAMIDERFAKSLRRLGADLDHVRTCLAGQCRHEPTRGEG